MKNMNWPDRVAYLENQLADSDRDNVSLRARLAEAERKIAAALQTAGGRWCEWGSRAESVRDILDGTADSADGSTT